MAEVILRFCDFFKRSLAFFFLTEETAEAVGSVARASLSIGGMEPQERPKERNRLR